MWHCRNPREPIRWPMLSLAVLRPTLSALLAAAPLAAPARCTSPDVPQPDLLMEGFISADCLACWRDRKTPQGAPGTLALDWIVPGLKGEGAPLATAATDDAMERLDYLRHPTPTKTDVVSTRREGDSVTLRLAHGAVMNNYVGTSMQLKEAGDEVWHAWLLLVEEIPAGAEGTPIARNLVRKVFRPDWGRVGRAPGPLAETRSMQVPETARPERLRLVGVLADGRGRIRAISRTECRE
jgi:hypothetical protein